MGDRLTQVQDCLDQLATQIFACYAYTTNFSSPAAIPGQPFQPGVKGEDKDRKDASTPAPESQATSQPVSQASGKPDKGTFAATLQELAQDLVIKEQQIEMLLGQLPGTDRTQEQQEERVRQLNDELESVQKEWQEANKRRDILRERVDQVILKTHRV